MRSEFTMSTDDHYPIRGTLEVRGTRARLEIGSAFGVFTDANEVERLANLIHKAAAHMRSNGSCPDCGGKGFATVDGCVCECKRCQAQGVIQFEKKSAIRTLCPRCGTDSYEREQESVEASLELPQTVSRVI